MAARPGQILYEAGIAPHGQRHRGAAPGEDETHHRGSDTLVDQTPPEPGIAFPAPPLWSSSQASPPARDAADAVHPLAQKPDESSLNSPVFIVGSPRSGTSILINGLMAAGYKGFREGNFLTLLRMFQISAQRHRTIFGTNVDKVLAGRIDWPAFINDISLVFKRHVDALNPVSPWVDKTGNPEMIEAIPQIRLLWPSAVFIFAKRRAIENISSRVKKFPEHTFEYHCRDWSRNMAAWRAVRDQVGLRGIEIDQQDIIRSPELVAARLGDILGAGPEARERIRATFTKDRPQQTEQGSAARVVSMDSVAWNAEQREIFLRLCWPEMVQFNYSANESYWANTPAAAVSGLTV
jgi:Sulfotransferase family